MKPVTRQIIEIALSNDETVAGDTKQIIQQAIDGLLPKLGDFPAQAEQSDHGKERLAYSVKEAAEVLGVSYSSCFRLVQQGLLKTNRSLRHHIISREAIEEFLRNA